MIFNSSGWLARMFFSFAMSATSSASSLRILSRSRPVSRCSCMSRIACDWISDRPKLVTNPILASGGFFDARISLMTASRLIERDLEAFENVGARFGLAQLELDPAPDDVAAEVDEMLDHVEQAQHLRPAGDDRQRDDAERLLQLGLLEQVVQHDLADFAALELDHDAHAVAIGFVAQVGNALERLVAHQLRDPLEQARLVQLVWNLGDDDLLPIALLGCFDLGLGAHLDRAAPGQEGLVDAALADNAAAGGEVGPGNQANELFELLLARDRLARSPAHQSSVFSIIQITPSITSPRLCGGMFVAMPTAMPVEPLTSRFG